MNYLDKIKNAMKPKLHEVEINGITFWVHRPSVADFAKCDSAENTIIHCVKDENGDPIFANEDVDGRVNVNQLDYVLAGKLNAAVIKLTVEDETDSIEKK